MKFAYADPPYPGQAKRHYAKDPSGICAEVNHRLLIAYLNEFDAWALSTSSVALREVLPLCPDDVRIGSFVKTFAPFKLHVNPAYVWEPVIFRGGRKRKLTELTVRDWVASHVPIGTGTHGAKSLRFAFWIFQLLGAQVGDEFEDVFPGSGVMTTAWSLCDHQPELDLCMQEAMEYGKTA